MELRSSRSRSRTPFLTPPTIITDETKQTTRITRSSTYKIESSSSKEESYGRTKRARGKVIRVKSSDYSSDDGDHEVSSSHMEQNSRNEYLEHSERSNGSSGGAAYRVYKESGEYWNRYPKTDYTYSPHSKDRIELAPGVVNMPNMSRKSIHDTPIMEYTHKETNTDYVDSYRTEETHNRNIRRANLFNNNNNNRETLTTKYTERRRVVKTESFWYRVVSYFWSFVVVGVERINGNVAGMVTWWHWMASRCMCLDVLLLRGNRSNKISAILALCLVPLLLLGGFLLSQAIMGIATSLSQITPMDTTNTPIATPTESSTPIEISIAEEATRTAQIQTPIVKPPRPNEQTSSIQQVQNGFTNAQLVQIAQNLKVALDLDVDPSTIVKIILEDPNLKRVDTGGNVLSEEQLAVILGQVKKSYNADRVVEKVLENPSIQGLFDTNKGEDMGRVISGLETEIERLRVGLNDVKTCCGGVRDEGFVRDVLKRFMLEFKGDVMGWFKEDLDGRVLGVKEEIREEFKGMLDGKEKMLMELVAQKLSRIEGVKVEGVDEEYVKGIVKGVLDVYDADKTGLVDYALESSGGQILSIRCTEQFQGRTAVFSIFGIPIWHPTHSPRVVISPGVSPGNCWCFQNFPGYLVIQLSANITIEAFSYEHVNKKLISDGKITSAPKDFSVYGLTSENERDPTLIGKYIFNSEGDSLQFFPAQRPNSVFNMVEFRVNSNHGNPQYTCLYRFRVHGKIFNKPT